MTWLTLNWKLAVIGMLAAALVGMGNMYLGKRDELAGFKATVEQAGKAAATANKLVETQHEDNLVQVRKDYEDKVPEIRSNAVANYVAAHPAVVRYRTVVRTVPADGASQPVDDDPVAECLPDEPFIENAAEDAAKLGAFQQYCKLNHCPIKD